MLTVKELKELLKECNDNDYISLEYVGNTMELEFGDAFSDIDSKDIEFNRNNVNILFN
jgi:uncharacterized hydantoinase/oxoprolinase family protein